MAYMYAQPLSYVTLMLVNYRAEALPPVNYRSEALPPVNYRSEALPPVNYRSEALPPVNYRSEALPPVNYRSEALPPVNYRAEALPPVNYRAEALPPVNYRSEALPPVNYRSEALPPVNYRSEALPPARRTIILSVSAFSSALTHLLPPSLPPSHLLYRYGLITQAQRAAINELYDFNPLVFDLACKRLARGPNGESFPPAVFKAHPKLPIQQPTASPSMTGPTNS